MSKTRERLVKLILSAVMIALSIAMTRMLPQEMVLALFGQTPLTVRLGLGLIPIYFASMALGPGWGAAVGGLADLLGYFVNPFGGAFFAAQDREKAKNLQIVHDFPGGKAYTTVSTRRYRVLIHLDLTAEIKEACL